jgi:hypothetical protein
MTLGGLTPGRIEQMLAQRDEAMLYLAAIVEKYGGEIRLGVEELDPDRILKKDTIGIAGVIVLRTEKP